MSRLVTDQLSNEAMDEDLVGNRKAVHRAGADGLDHRNASLRKPFSYNASVGRRLHAGKLKPPRR